MGFFDKEVIKDPVLDQWSGDEVLIVMAAAQDLPDSEPGKEALLAEVDHVKAVVQADIMAYDLDRRSPKVVEAQELGLLSRPLTEKDLKTDGYDEAEIRRHELALMVSDYFRAGSMAASLMDQPAVISEEYAPLLSRALRDQAAADPNGHFGQASQIVLETHGLMPQPGRGAQLLRLVGLR